MSVFSDFDWSWRGVRVRETGAEIAFSFDLARDVWRGGSYIVREALRPRAPTIVTAVFPLTKPRPWYLLWGALRQAGVRSGSDGALAVHFSDDTTRAAEPCKDKIHINCLCTDISKSHVAEIFGSVFGYGLSLDPETATTSFLEKGEANGVHDAHIRTSPTSRQDNRVYQKLIDNRTEDGTVLDFRCPTVFGKIPLVFLKERPIDQRFANLNTRVRLSTAEAHFSNEEIEKIATFCAAMNLQWGGLDILRDKADGRLYIVDVNKTDMGPPLALPIKEKLFAVKTLGNALRVSLLERLS